MSWIPCDHVVSSLPTSNSVETRWMLFFVEGIQIEMLVEHAPIDCDKQNDDMASNIISYDIVAIHIFESTEPKTDPCQNPHKDQRKSPTHQNSLSHSSLVFRSLQRRHERMNYGPIPTISFDCGWINGWSCNNLNNCSHTSYNFVSFIMKL